MRGKLIAVFSVIVTLVGVLAFALMYVRVGELVQNPDQARADAARSAAAANAEFQLNALRFERWLADEANDPGAKEPFLRTLGARSDQATEQAGRFKQLAAVAFKDTPPVVVAFVDEGGVAIGRDGSTLLRGDKLGAAYPSLLDALKKGGTGSEVWVNKARNEQLLMSFASIRDASGKVIGALLLGTPLDDGLLTRISDNTSGRALLFVVSQDGNFDVVAKSNSASATVVSAVAAMKTSLPSALGATRPQALQGGPDQFMSAGTAVSGFGDGKRAELVAFSPIALVDSVTSVIWPIFAVAALGIALVIVAGYLLGTYFTAPIVELEGGILAIINGQAERRFELDHPDFGGLAFSINSLLNQLQGVQEDNTDEEGRPSRAPAAAPQNFDNDQGAPPEEKSGPVDTDVAALKAEPEAAYYQRLFNEYVAAKKSAGDAPEHIPAQDAFVTRIKSLEQDAAAKHGGPVRYKVELRGKEVMLVIVQL